MKNKEYEFYGNYGEIHIEIYWEQIWDRLKSLKCKFTGGHKWKDDECLKCGSYNGPAYA